MHKKTSKKLKNRVFTRKHYQSNDGMLTTVWGPSTWHLLHTMSFNYPVNPTCDDKNNYRDFILNLQNVLPCGKCRKNLKKNFKKFPLLLKHMACRDSFSKYIYRLHELVNKMLGKKSGLTYEDIRERYEHFRSRCAKSLEELKYEQEEADKNKKENGCTEPLYGEKSKCILNIVPHDAPMKTFSIDEKCKKTRGEPVPENV
jgi:hypothetical protein